MTVETVAHDFATCCVALELDPYTEAARLTNQTADTFRTVRGHRTRVTAEQIREAVDAVPWAAPTTKENHR